MKHTSLVLLLLVTLFSLSLFACENDKQIGLQLWSLRADMADDPLGTIEQVGEIGYDFVE
jgi:hypothetical protein